MVLVLPLPTRIWSFGGSCCTHVLVGTTLACWSLPSLLTAGPRAVWSRQAVQGIIMYAFQALHLPYPSLKSLCELFNAIPSRYSNDPTSVSAYYLAVVVIASPPGSGCPTCNDFNWGLLTVNETNSYMWNLFCLLAFKHYDLCCNFFLSNDT